MTTRCRNHPERRGLKFPRQCAREASGEDGLCNVCRAAKTSGEKRSQARYDEQTVRIARRQELSAARGRVIRAARTFAHVMEVDSDELFAAVAALEKLENAPPTKILDPG